jgi:hypothetical protein
MSDNDGIENETPSAGVTVSLSDEAKAHLQSFTGYDGAPFKEMMDAFRFAVSLAMAHCGNEAPELESQPGTTLYNLGSFDSNQTFKEAIQAIAPEAYAQTSLTRLIRSYGEKGIGLMIEHCEGDPSSFALEDALEDIHSLADSQT